MKKLLTLVFASCFCLITGNLMAQSLTVSTTSINLGSVEVGSTATGTFTVTGTNIRNSGVTISSNNAQLTVSPTSLTKNEAQAGATITLTLSPTTGGSGSATVTVSSSRATDRTVTVSWTATVPPTLTVSETYINFGNVNVDATATRTFTVSGVSLTGNVSLSSNNAQLTVSPSSITKANAESGNQTVTLTLTPTAAAIGSAKVTIASQDATSQNVTVSWNSTGGNLPAGVVELPNTLDKSNFSGASAGMTYYNSTYFELGGDAYAEWTVYLSHPGNYFVSEQGYYHWGHNYLLELRDGNTVKSSYTTATTYDSGELTISQGTKWNLSSVPAGQYTLRVKCNLSGGDPCLKSLTLDYEGEIIPVIPVPDPDPNGAHVTYTADNSTIFPNPERGFYYHFEKHLTTSDPYCIKNSTTELDSHISDKGSLVLLVYYLDAYKSTTIPQTILNAFDEDMATLRSKGVKCIIRYAYTDSDAGEIGHDAPLSIVQQHINQLKPKWQANADVIFCFQVGWVGSWGEWYYSEYFGNKTSHMNADRISVVDAMLDAVPEDRCILIRTPLFKTEYIGSTTPLGYMEAYTGTPKSRIGHHNDAYLYGGEDQGTYSDTAVQKPYLAQETLYVPAGGETNETNSTAAQTKASYNNTIAETSRLHYTFINQGYAPEMTSVWRSNGAYDALRKWLGYRFQLVDGTYTQQAAPGGVMSVYMNIKNTGYAPLYNERPVFIVLKNNSNTYMIQMSADPRRWRPNGETTTVSEILNLPANIAVGTYSLYLYMPDAYESLRSNSKYSVRFANGNNMWDDNTGMNNLNASITISNNVSTPTLSVSPTTVSFGDVMMATTDTRTISVSGVNLLGNVTVSSNNAALTVSPATITPAEAAAGATVTLSVHPTTTGSGSATVTIASSGATTQTVSVSWNGTAITGAVELPATLNKANVTTYSGDMTWYGTGDSYFDYGPTDATNTGRWAEWNVYLSHPNEYTISEVSYCANGHRWLLELLSGNTVIASDTTSDDHWGAGDQNYAQDVKWNLSNVPAGVYTLRVRNVTEWGQPKLQSITLECDALLTSHTVTWNATQNGGSCATSTSEIAIDDPLGTLPTATKSGYVCIGWFDSATGGHQVDEETVPTSNVTYYAQFLPIPQLSGTAVDLPNTLNKANMGAVSEDMTYYGTNNDFFDLGPTDATNLYRWAAWRVNLIQPGNYTVTEETDCTTGHQYIMQLFSGNNLVAEYTTTKASATSGAQVFVEATPWNLSGLSAGTYTLMVRNVYAWAQPKLKRLTLDCPTCSTPTYTVTWNATQNGGTCATASTTITQGDPVGTLPTATKTGYTFTGWFTAAAGGTQISASTVPTGDVTYYAQFAINSHTLTVVANNANYGTVSGGGTYNYGTSHTITATANAGYDFSMWTLGGVQASTSASYSVVMPDEDVTYTAVFVAGTHTAYTVKHYWQNILNDQYTDHESETLYGTTGATTTAAAKTYTGFSAQSFNQSTIAANGSTVIEIYYNRNTYTITWKDGDNQTIETDLNVKYGATPSYDGSTPTKTATAQYTYTFNNTWSPAVAAVTGNQTYVAQFDQTVNTYTVSFNANGHGTAPNSQTIAYGSKVTQPTAPTETGYTFGGWYKEAACTNVWNFSTDVVQGNTVLYAKWTPNTNTAYTVKHYWQNILNDQYTEHESETLYGTTGATTTAAAKTYTGFSAQSFNQSTIAANGSTVIEIYYNRNTYTITWKDGDNQTIETDLNVKYGATPSYDGSTPTKTATAQYTYTFNNTWSPAVAAVTGNQTYVAQFDQTVNQYTLTVNGGSGSGTYDYGTVVTLTATPAANYHFTQWSDNVMTASRQVTVTANATYTALSEEDAKTTVYLVPGVWSADNAKYAAYVFEDGKAAAWSGLMMQTADGKAYTTQVYAYSNIIFVRLKNTATSGNWDDKWNQTGDLALNTSTYNCYQMTGWGSGFWRNYPFYYVEFQDYDGTVLGRDTVDSGHAATAPTAPTRTGYTFAGWDNLFSNVTADMTVTAQYTPNTNTAYTVRHMWQNIDDDGYTLHESESKTGTTGSNTAAASKTYTGFTAKSFNQSIIAANGSTVVDIYYDRKTYTITWKDGDNNTIETDLNVKYGAMPSYNGSTPTKTATAQYTYTFNNTWSPAIAEVTGNQTYVAQFDQTVNEYTITWKNDDGTVIDHTTVAYGATPSHAAVSKAATAQYTYTFVGWTPTIVPVTGDAEYTAVFTAATNTYTVSFHANGHGTDPDAQTVAYGAKATQPTISSVDGYTFGGWYREAACTTPWDFAANTVTGNVDLYALWTLNSWMLTWDLAGGTITTAGTPDGLTAYGTALTAPEVALTGYEFAGWSPEVPASMPDHDATYTATWSAAGDTKYTVRHLWQNIDDDEYTEHESEEKHGATGSQTAAVANTYTGFTALAITQQTIAADGTTVVEVKYNRKTYLIAFVADGMTLKSETLRYGAMPIAPANPTKAADAQYTYTFAGWNQEITAVTGAATYVAQWNTTVNEYTITWKNDDGTVIDHTTVAYGATPSHAAVSKAATAQYTYTFVGWTPTIVPVTGDATYTAVFSAATNTYTVSFHANGHGTDPDAQTVVYGAKATQPTISSVEGYTFGGWYTEAACTTPWDFAANTVTGNVDLYALWTLNSWMLTWDLAGGTITTAGTPDGLTAYGTALTAPEVALTGYEFAGWSPAVPASMPDHNATYTATWSAAGDTKYTVRHLWQNIDDDEYTEHESEEKHGATGSQTAAVANTYTGFTALAITQQTIAADGTTVVEVKYNRKTYLIAFVADGITLKSETLRYGAMPIAPANPTKAADAQYTYTFAGWNQEITAVTGAATYVAQWNTTAIIYSGITFTSGDETMGSVTVEGEKSGYEYGDQVTVTATANDGYTFTGWSDGSTDNPHTITITDQTESVTAIFVPSTHTAYTVRHLQQNINDDEYTEFETETLYGTTGEQTEAAANTYTGFIAQTIVQKSIAADGKTVVDVKYNRQTFLIAFVADGMTLKSETLRYGAMPVAPANPTKEADAQYTYTFTGWYPAVAEVTGAATYVAQFDATLKTFGNVTIGSADPAQGTVTVTPEQETYTYNDEITVTATPSEGYTFEAWVDGEGNVISTDSSTTIIITGDISITATFTANLYVIIFQNEDGTELQRSEVAYGVLPEYTGVTPTKDEDADYTYTFIGWTPEIAVATGDATYTAVFEATPIDHTGIESVVITGNSIDGPKGMRIYDYTGKDVTSLKNNLYNGTYIIVVDGKTRKVAITR